MDCKKSCQNSGGKAFGSSIILLQKASMPAPIFSRPKPVLIIDCKIYIEEHKVGEAKVRKRNLLAWLLMVVAGAITIISRRVL